MEVPEIIVQDADGNPVQDANENQSKNAEGYTISPSIEKLGSEHASQAKLSKDSLKAPSVPEVQDFPVHQLTNEELSAITDELGIILTSFPENMSPVFEGETDFPESYYTVSAKERLMLLFAENFRRQFMDKYSRRPLILALRNECDVQKFVSTTIRPTAFLFTDMIREWEPCGSFVADYIIYECLEKPIVMPNRLISPDTLLKRRRGNCLEMATLLCSLLVGAGFAACVVSGYANREVTLNDQQRVICPHIPQPVEVVPEPPKPRCKYALRDAPDLRSQFLLEVEKLEEDKKLQALKKIEDERLKQRELEEKLPTDPYEGRRVHSWVVIIEHALWCYRPGERPEQTGLEDDEVIEPTAFFIEPTTGFRHEVDSPNYLGIESVWNQYNYYVNRQEPITNIAGMRWDLSRTEDWEHLLVAEPYELRTERPLPADIECLSFEEELSKEKHLDMPFSWVSKLHIDLPDYEERYPNGEKCIFYKRAVYERFAPYHKKDGLMKRLTLYETLDYEYALTRWEWYENRHDFLNLITIDFKNKLTVEEFHKGRPDLLKVFTHNEDPDVDIIFEFDPIPRFDALEKIIVNPNYVKEFYAKRDDLLYFRQYYLQLSDQILIYPVVTDIKEKFYRNIKKPADSDIAMRQFYLQANRIFIRFHYNEDCITASTCEFIKPPKPDYGEEVIYNPDETSGYSASPIKPPPKLVDRYVLLLEQLNEEKIRKKLFEERWIYIKKLTALRETEMKEPQLNFSVFDPLRNGTARKLRLEKFAEEQAHDELVKSQKPDFLGPYLVKFDYEANKGRLAAQACLEDLKSFYLDMLNELQRRYDELSSESKSIKKFILKFQDQFDDFNYERLIQQGEEIERNKRIVQERLINVKQQSQEKYDALKLSIEKDERLK